MNLFLITMLLKLVTYQLILSVVFTAVRMAERNRTGLIFFVSFETKACSAILCVALKILI